MHWSKKKKSDEKSVEINIMGPKTWYIFFVRLLLNEEIRIIDIDDV